MIINLLVAATENNVIGKNNRLLWHLPEDMAFFKNTTWGMPVIMGRKTFESMGRPLKGRTNIVISRRGRVEEAEGIITTNSLEDALNSAEGTDAKECYVIGGGEIFSLAMPFAQRIYMTRVHTEMEGDTFFPVIDSSQWKLSASTSFNADEKHAFPYTFETWQKMTDN